ncbi:hypothetical protein MES4922_60043 [Mesorhizobium ventifaucium]|uniref:Uncharacterized protein n=1 Tax=Mesorhizobium ventifaucium TaxID=666020 RepID=A0ABM9ECM8_9HYPH|nr:hypothetical protein MES4922_60043 [Mesorhizobium ventifaucium]
MPSDTIPSARIMAQSSQPPSALASRHFTPKTSTYTEDLNHGQAYGSVVAINPFRTH